MAKGKCVPVRGGASRRWRLDGAGPYRTWGPGCLDLDAMEPLEFFWGYGCVWGFLLGTVDASLAPDATALFSGPQKYLAMDEERVEKPAGPPTRKKFLIPVDEDEVPPPGVGLGDGGTAGRLGGWLGGRGTGRGLWDHSVG